MEALVIEYVVGDLIASNEVNIAHGANCKGVMGAGIARVIAEAYPEVRRQYQLRCVSHQFVLGSAFPVIPAGMKRTVWNLGTQKQPGADATVWGIMLSFANMFERMVRMNVRRVAIPRIGCGIGGLKWSQVEATIESLYSYVPDAPVVVVYTQQSQEHIQW